MASAGLSAAVVVWEAGSEAVCDMAQPVTTSTETAAIMAKVRVARMNSSSQIDGENLEPNAALTSKLLGKPNGRLRPCAGAALVSEIPKHFPLLRGVVEARAPLADGVGIYLLIGHAPPAFGLAGGRGCVVVEAHRAVFERAGEQR